MDYAMTADRIREWLNNYAEDNKRKGFVVGLSGGIDSAVTSTLCAMTGKNTLVVKMPIHHYDMVLAVKHTTWLIERKQYLNVIRADIDLTEPFKAFKKAMPPKVGEDELVMANTASRMRMMALYALAAKSDLLVVGTGNKVEDFGVGFFTKYGDGGVDISPIGDLTKTQVRGLAKHLGILSGIQNAAPKDGLWKDNRTDEDQLGATYEELEWAMNFEKAGAPGVPLTERQKVVLKIYRVRHKANEHKMKPIPVYRLEDIL